VPSLGITAAAPAEESLAKVQAGLASEEAGTETALAESSALFDQASTPVGDDAAVEAGLAAEAGLADAFEAVFAEHPEAEEALADRFRSSAYGSLALESAWKADLAVAMRPWMSWRAAELGYPTLARYLGFVRADTIHAASEREGLAKLLVGHTEHRAEEWTYIFRDYPLWKAPLERYLDTLIARRKGVRTISLQSVGAGYGSEAYSLAIMTEQALRRAGEDPGTWRVAIRAYDVSLLSLLTTGRGLYKLGERDTAVFKALGLEPYFDQRPGGLLQLKGPLAGWIKPVWADLNDLNQHPIVTDQRTDVVFANYLLYHLRMAPGHALADHWLSGSWAEHGFLSMAQVAVGEVGSSRLEPASLIGRDFLGYHYGGNIGWAGRAFYGDSFSANGGLLRQWWRKLRRPAGRAVLAAGMSFLSSLTHDPFFRAPVNEGVLAWLSEAAQATGLEIVLTTQDVLAQRDGDRLHLNVGWVLSPDADQSLLEEFVAEETARVPLPGETGPARVTARTEEGAVLKLVSDQAGTWLSWLSERFTPISIAFHSDNAAKLLHEPEPEDEPQVSGRPGIRVYGLR
jgi:chemotaxis methyl-accepting protein methylase